MSDQQSLQQATVYNMASGGRPADPNLMNFSLYPSNTQLGVPAGAPMHGTYYTPTVPVRRHMPAFYGDPQRFCFFDPSQIGNQVPSAPADYASLNLAQMNYQHLQYSQQNHVPQQQLPQSQPVPSIPQQMRRTTLNQTTREKKPLNVFDPRTKAPIILRKETADISELSNDISSVIIAKESIVQMHSKPTHDTVTTIPSIIQTEENVELAVVDEVSNDKSKQLLPDPMLQESDVLETEVENCILKKTASELLSDNEADIYTESDTSDDENNPDRRTYDRDFILSCRDSPIAHKQLVQLANYFADYRPRKTHRSTNRQQPRVIRIPTNITVKRIENAFVPSQLQTTESAADMDHPKMLSRELNIILNRVSDGNLMETVEEIKSQKYTSSLDLHQLAKLVYQKSIRQAKYSKVFASLCKHLKGFTIAGSESFEVLILKQVQELFQTPLDTLIEELNAAIDAKIASAKDDAIKKMLEEDRETNVAKKTEAYYGCITLLGELYLCRLVTPKTMQDCLKKLNNSNAPEALSSMLLLLGLCGQDMEQNLKNVVDMSFARLEQISKSDKVPTHQLFKIQELVSLRERNWKELLNHALPPTQAPRRQPDIKARWSAVQDADTRRKVVPFNPITPSSLAVNQQPYDTRKLGPTVANWSQGSGQLKNSNDDKSNNVSVSTGRSREASPRVSSGPQGAWIIPLTKTLDQKHSHPKEECTNLENIKRKARSVVQILIAKEDTYLDIFEKCRDSEKIAVLHAVLESVMDKSSTVRMHVGVMCLQLWEKRIPKQSGLILAFERFFKTCDADWLEDYPLGWEYIAEILQHLIQKEPDHFTLLLSIVNPLKSEQRGANILAHCFRLSAVRLGKDFIANTCRTHHLDWIKLGVPSGGVASFVDRHSIAFTLGNKGDSSCDTQLKELITLMESDNVTGDKINAYFRQLSQETVPLPPDFIRSCMRALVSKSTGFSRPKIDDCVIGLGILIDHNPDRESQVLQGVKEGDVHADQWFKSLLDKKIVSSEAITNWRNTSNGDGIKQKNLNRDK